MYAATTSMVKKPLNNDSQIT